VTWQGPGARYDEIQIWDPNAKGGEGKKLTGRRLRNDDYDNNKVTIKAPDKPGTYQLRYYNGDNRAVLAEREIAVQ
jgi:Ca-activated chloride channel family protein